MWHCLILYLKKSSHAKVKKSSHAREREIKTKEGKHTKQCNHKYEICL